MFKSLLYLYFLILYVINNKFLAAGKVYVNLPIIVVIAPY
jgi:hypothetical protein